MTNDVEVNDRFVRYVATAGQKIFDIDFPIDNANELEAYVNGVLADPEDYAVDLATLELEFDDGLEDGDIVTLQGADPVDRKDAYAVRGGLRSDQMNTEARNIYRQLQELRRDVSRCLSLNKAEALSAVAGLGLLTANAVLAVNPTGDGFVMGPLTSDYAAFAQLQDVEFTGLANNDAIVYDLAEGKWVNKTPSHMRAALGLAIGSNVQAYDAELAAFAGLTSAADKIGYFTGAGTMATADFTSAARALLDDANAGAMRTTLGLAIGTDVQAYDAELAAFAGLTSAADTIGYFTGAGTMTTTPFTTAARLLLQLTTAADMRGQLGLGLGSDVQPYDPELAALASLVSAANKIPMFTGSGTATLIDFKDEDNFASDSATSVPSQQSVKAYVDAAIAGVGGGPGGGDVVASNYGTEYSANYALLRSNIGLAIGTNVQAYDAELAALAGVSSAANKLPYFTGSGTASLADFTAGGRALVNSAGTADTFPYFSASNTVTLGTLTTAGRAILDDADATAQRVTLGLVIGTNVQAYDAELAALAGLVSAANKIPMFSGSGTASLIDFSTSTSLGTSNTTIASQGAVKSYVDTAVAGVAVPNGTIIQSVGATYSSNADLSTTIPNDDTIPQNTEGTEIVTVTITPTSATSTIEIEFAGGAAGSASVANVAALFKDSGANALQVSVLTPGSVALMNMHKLIYRESAGNTTARTYKIRVGQNSGTMRMNGSTSARLYGGAMASYLIAREVKG